MWTWWQFDLASVLYAVLSLTVVRTLPVAVALVGSRSHNLASLDPTAPEHQKVEG
jgi:hypothetical protein